MINVPRKIVSVEIGPKIRLVGQLLTCTCLFLCILSIIFSFGTLILGEDAGIIEIPTSLNKLKSPMHLGESIDLKIVINNNTRKKVIILGSNDFCSRVCFAGRNLPLTLMPHTLSTLVVHLAANGPGRFREDLTFFTSSVSQPTLKITIEGEVDGPINFGQPRR